MLKKRLIIYFRYIIAIVFLFLLSQEAYSHVGHSHGGARKKIGSQGKGFIKAAIPEDDTSKVIIDIYGNVGVFLAPNIDDGVRGGDPLGTGGQMPLYYNLLLHPQHPFSALPPTIDRDYRIDASNFGYIPIWDPSELSMRMRYRFQREVSALIDMGFTEQQDPEYGAASWAASLSQLALKWTPAAVKGISLRAGHLLDISRFSTIFGQAPLESNSYQGLSFRYKRKLGKSKWYSIGISGGATYLNRVLHIGKTKDQDRVKKYYYVPTEYKDTDGDGIIDDTIQAKYSPKSSTHAGNFGQTRIRTSINGKFGFQFNEKLSLNYLVGIQAVPGDSAYYYFDNNDPGLFQLLEKSFGWMTGLEIGYTWDFMEQVISIIYGSGDVEMGWGAPDYVYYLRPYNSLPGDKHLDMDYFSRNESSLLNSVYWGGLSKNKFQMDWGAWYSYHNPGSNSVTWGNFNKGLIDLTTKDSIPDSLVPILFPDYTSNIDLPDSVNINTQPFSMIKFGIDPSYKFGNITRLGLRYDRIQFLNPDAHTNTQEWERENYIHPYYAHPDLNYPLIKPSKWELEAVNANIISPYLALEIGGILTLKFLYALGFYDKKVRRHGEYEKFHSNFNFITNVFYTFTSAGKSGGLSGNISKEDAMKRATQEIVKLVQSNKLERSWITVKPESAKKKKFETSKQWVVSFYNDEIDDDDKCDLYIFLTLEGYFLNYNHFGE